jgi:hypothetical protein
MEKYKIEVEADTKNSVKNLEELESVLHDVNAEAIPLTTQMGELEDQLILMAHAGQQNTKEWKEMAQTVAGMRKTVRDVDMDIEALSMTTSQQLGGALGGVTGAFETAQGVMGAFGVSGEAVEETLLKVQSAMAIAQGVQGIKEAIPAFKAMGTSIMSTAVAQNVLTGAQKLYNLVVGKSVGAMKTLKLAIAATGIGALVLVLVEVASAMDLFGDSSEDAEKKQKKLEDQMARTAEQMKYISELSNQSVEDNDQYTETLIKQAKSRGASEEEVNKIIKQNIQDNLKEREEEVKKQHAIYQQVVDDKNSNLKALEEAEKAWTDSIGKETEARRKLTNFDLDQDVKSFEEAQAKRQAAQQKYADERKSALQEIRDAEKEYHLNLMGDEERELYVSREKYKALLDYAKKYGVDNKELINAQKNEENDIKVKYAELEQATEEEKQAKLDEINQEAKNNRIAQENEFLLQLELLQEENYLASLSDRDREITLVNDKYYQLEQAALGNAEQEAVIAEAKARELGVITDEFNKSDLEKTKELQAQKVDAVQGGLNAIASLAETFAGDSLKSQKRAFKIQKAANIASATIDTYKSAQSAFASAGNPILGAVFAGIAVAAGIANIVKISKTKFEGGDSGSSIPSASSGGGGAGSIITPQFNIVGNSPINQLASLSGQPVKAYVVSGEVSSAQSLDRNRVQNATL